jgi:hypothetical protein
MVSSALLNKLDTGTARRPSHRVRRLSDKILIAFHQSCDQREFDVAKELLQIFEGMMLRLPVDQADPRHCQGYENLVAAHERLWFLRHSKIGDHYEGAPL